MTQYIDKSALVAEIDDWRDKIKKGIFSIPLTGSDKAYATFEYEILGKVRDFLDTLEVKEAEEEPVSNDLEEAASQYPSIICQISPQWKSEVENVFKAGAQWQKEQMEKEMGLEKEFDNYTKDILACDIQFEPFTHLHNCAKYFFELGLRAKGE